LLGGALGLAAVLVALFLIARWLTANAPPSEISARASWQAAADAGAPPPPGLSSLQNADCGQGLNDAAQANAASRSSLYWSPWGRPEVGWRTYEPAIARELGSACPGDSPGFAAALSRWQRAHRLDGDGRLDEATFSTLRTIWASRRPFVRISHIACPPGADEAALATGTAADGYEGTVVRLRPGALAAYHRMRAAARRDLPDLAPGLLTIFSAYRSPERDAARCALEGNCHSITRASCSAHRTGLAMDINLGSAPGYPVDSSADPNRLYMSQTPAYRWLVAHAGEYGFVNYPFEPWHWEWTGEAP
jgi:D-alanyl-D-alanine carboxypeptidase